MTDPDLDRLVGERLSSVCFVTDSVEFHFDGPILRSLSHPTLTTPQVTIRFPAPGSRDALCGLIGSEVAAVDLIEDVKIEVSFTSGARVLIPLDDGNRRGPEAAHFVPGIDQPIQVF